MNIIVPPHLKIAIKVEDPLSIIDEAVQILKRIVNKDFYFPGSKYNDCFAIAQPQVSDKPLKYFVINPSKKELVESFGGEIIINPQLVKKDKLTRIMHPEGCMSYPFRPIKKTKRFSKIWVNYVIIKDIKGRTFEKIENKGLEGVPAIVFQHEFQHMNGKSIFSK